MDWASSEWMQDLSPVALQKVQGLEEQVRWMQKERQQKKLKIDNLEQTIHNQKLKLEEEKAENTSLQREVQKLEEQCKDSENKHARLQNEIQMRDAKISLLESQLGQMKASINMVHQLEADIACHKAQIKKAEQKSAELESALKNQEEISLRLQEQLVAFQSDVNEYSSSSDLMCFDDSRKSEDLSHLREQIADQETTISELKSKLSEASDEAEQDLLQPVLQSEYPESQHDAFWDKFESQSSSDLRRNIRVKSDSASLLSQEDANEKVILLEQHLQQVNCEFECDRSSTEVIGSQLASDFIEDEELRAEVEDVTRVFADCRSKLQEAKLIVQQDIEVAREINEEIALRVEKVNKEKLEADHTLGLLATRTRELEAMIQEQKVSNSMWEASLKESRELYLALMHENQQNLLINEAMRMELERLGVEHIDKHESSATDTEKLGKTSPENLVESESGSSLPAVQYAGEKDEMGKNSKQLQDEKKSLEIKIKLLEEELAQVFDDNKVKVEAIESNEKALAELEMSLQQQKLVLNDLEMNCRQLQDEKESLVDKIKLLNGDMQQVNNDNKAKNEVIESNEKELAELRMSVEQQRSVLNDLEMNSKQLQGEKEALEVKIKFLEGDMDRVNNENKAKIEIMESNETALSELRTSLEQQRLEKNEMEINSRQLQDEKESLEVRIKLLKGELTQVIDDNKAKVEAIESNEKVLAELEMNLENQKLALNDLEMNMKQLQDEKESLEVKIKLLEEDMVQVNGDNKAKNEVVESNEKEIAELRMSIEQQRSLLNDLEMNCKQLQGEREALEVKIKLMEKEMKCVDDDNKAKIEIIEFNERELAELRMSVEQQRLILNDLELQLDNREGQAQSFSSRILLLEQQVQQAVNERDEKVQELESVQRALLSLKKDYDEKVSQLVHTVTDLNARFEMTQRKQKEFEELIRSLELQLEESTTAISALNEEISTAKISSEQQQMIMRELEIGNKELLEQKVAFEAEIDNLKLEISAKNDELNSVAKELSNLKTEYEKATQVNENLMQSDAERDTELKAVLETLITLEEQACVLQSSLTEKEDQISSLTEEAITLKETLEQQVMVVNDLQMCSEHVEKEKLALQEKITNLVAELVEANNNVEIKNEVVESLGSELSGLKDEMVNKTLINEQLHMQNQTLMSENENLRLEAVQMNTEICSFKNETITTKTSLEEEIDKRMRETEEANHQLKTSQEKLTEVSDELAHLTLVMAEKDEMIEQLQSEVSSLNGSLEQQLTLVNTLQASNECDKKQNILLETKLKILEQELEEINLDLEFQNKTLNCTKQEISDLELRYNEKATKMHSVTEALLEVDEQLKPVNGLLQEVETKMQTLESQHQELDDTILALKEEIAALKLAVEEHETARHIHGAEVFRYKMSCECLEGKLHELQSKAESEIKLERDQAIDLKVLLLQKNPKYAQQFSDCDIQEMRDIAATTSINDIALYIASVNNEITKLSAELEKLETHKEKQQILINSLEEKLQLSEDAIKLKNYALQEVTGSFNAQAVVLNDAEEQLKILEGELSTVKKTSDTLKVELSESQAKFQSLSQMMEGIRSDNQSTKKNLAEQHAITTEFEGQLQQERLVVNKLMQDLTEVKHLATNCLHSFGQDAIELDSESDLSSHIKDIMKELQSAVMKLMEKQRENELYISNSDKNSQALLKILQGYDSALLKKGSTTKDLQDKLNAEKNTVTSLTQMLHDQNIFSENREIVTFKLRNDLETCVCSIRNMVQKMAKLKKHFRKNLSHSRKITNKTQKFRRKIMNLKKCEKRLIKALKSEKCNVFKMSSLFANLFEVLIEKLTSSSSWSIEDLLSYASSYFPEVISPNAVQNFSCKLQQVTPLNSKSMANNSELVSIVQDVDAYKPREVSANPEVAIIKNIYYFSSTMERLVSVVKEYDNLKKEAAHWKMQCEVHLSELCSRKKIISDLENTNCEFMGKIENFMCELDNVTKGKQAMEERLHDIIAAENEVKEEKKELEQLLEQLQSERNEEMANMLKTIVIKEQACFEMNKVIKELEENLQRTNKKNKELHREVQHVTGGLKDLQKVISDNMESYYSPAQYEALEAKKKTFQKESESLQERNSEISSLIEEIEAVVLCMLNEFPCEITYSSQEDIPAIIQKLQGNFRQEFFKEKSALDLKNKEVIAFEKSVNDLMNQLDTETHMIEENTQENKKLQVLLKEAENQLQCHLEELKTKDVEIFNLNQSAEKLQKELELVNSKLKMAHNVEENFQKASLEKHQLKEALDRVLADHICDYEDTCASLDDIPVALRKLCDELVLKKAELQELQIRLNETKDQLESCSEDLQGKENEISNWKTEFDASNKSLVEVREQITTLESVNSRLSLTVEEIEAHLQKLQHEKQQLKDTFDRILGEHVSDYSDACASLDDVPAAVQTLLTQQEKIVNDMKINIDLKNGEIVAMEKSIGELMTRAKVDENFLYERNQDIQQLKTKLEESDGQLQNYIKMSQVEKEDEANDWKAKCNDLTASVGELKTQLTSLESERLLLNSTMEEVEENLQKTCFEKQQFKTDVDRILAKHISYYGDVSSFDLIPSFVQKLSDELTEKKNEVDELRLDVDLKNEELTVLEMTVKELTEKMECEAKLQMEKAEEIEQLKVKFEEVETQMRIYSQESQGKECEISDWKTKYDAARKSVEELQAQLMDLKLNNTKLNSVINDLEENVQRITLDKKQLKESLRNILTECTSNYEHSSSVEVIVTAIQKVCDTFAQQVNEINELSVAIDSKNEEIMGLEKSNKEVKERIVANEILLSNRMQEIQQLENKLEESDDQLQSYCRDFTGKNSEISEWKSKYDASNNLVEELQKQLSDLELVNASLNSTIDEVEENLQMVFLEKQNLKNTLSKILSGHDFNSENACSEFEDVLIAIKKLHGDFAENRKEVEQMKQTIESRNEEIASLKTDGEKLVENMDGQATSLTEKTQEIQQLQMKLIESESHLQKCLADAKNKDNEISDWKSKNNTFRESMEKLKKTLATSESSNAMLNSTIDEIEENLQKVYLKKQQLKDSLDDILMEYIPNYREVCLVLENIPGIVQRLYNEFTQQRSELSEAKLAVDLKNEELMAFEMSNKSLSNEMNEKTVLLANKLQEIEQLQTRLNYFDSQFQGFCNDLEDPALKLGFDRNKNLIKTFEETIPWNEVKERVLVMIQQYQEKIGKLRDENKAKAELLTKQELAAKESTNLLKNQNRSIEELRNINDEVTRHCKELNKEICNLQQETNQLRKSVEDFKETEITLQKFQAANEALQKDVLGWKAKCDNPLSVERSSQDNTSRNTNGVCNPAVISNDQDYFSVQTSELAVQLQTLEKEKIILEGQLSVLRSTSEKAEKTEHHLRMKIKQLEHDLLSNQQKLDEQQLSVQEKSKTIENLTMNISNMKLEHEELLSRKDLLQEKLKKLDTELVQCKSDYRTMDNNLEILKLERKSIMSENKALQSVVADLKLKAEMLEELRTLKNELESQSSDKKDTKAVKESKDSLEQGNKKLDATEFVLKEFFETATKILNVIISKGDHTSHVTDKADAEVPAAEIACKDTAEQEQFQLQFSTMLQSLTSLNEKLSHLFAEIAPIDVNTELCNESKGSSQNLMDILEEFKNCLTTLCAYAYTCRTKSERFNKLQQELHALHSESTTHSSCSSKISQLEDQVKKLLAEKQSLDGKMVLLKINSYRLEKCLLEQQKQYTELQDKMQKEESSCAACESAPNHQLERKVEELTEELREVNEKLEKSQTDLLDAYGDQAEIQRKFDASRRQCLSLRAHLQHFQNKLKERTEDGNVPKAGLLKDDTKGMTSLHQENTAKPRKTLEKENCSPNS